MYTPWYYFPEDSIDFDINCTGSEFSLQSCLHGLEPVLTAVTCDMFVGVQCLGETSATHVYYNIYLLGSSLVEYKIEQCMKVVARVIIGRSCQSVSLSVC